MQLMGFFKRVVPFFLTFALGLLVASFFVTVAAPNFNFKARKHRCREYRENYRLRVENERLRETNDALRRQMADAEVKTVFRPALDTELVPPPPPMPPRAVR